MKTVTLRRSLAIVVLTIAVLFGALVAFQISFYLSADEDEVVAEGCLTLSYSMSAVEIKEKSAYRIDFKWTETRQQEIKRVRRVEESLALDITSFIQDLPDMYGVRAIGGFTIEGDAGLLKKLPVAVYIFAEPIE